MHSVKEKFLLALSISDEGIEMMLQRIRRQNPDADAAKLKKLLQIEMRKSKKSALPAHLKLSHNV